VKPFEFEELLMRIQALLKRPKTIEKQIIDLPYDIQVDLS
jgi:DNA-binding response OmpR family regulator